MILSEFERTTGRIVGGAHTHTDCRVPVVPFQSPGGRWTAPMLCGWSNDADHPNGACRHTFDVIGSTRTTTTYDSEDRDTSTTEFRQVLTCISCGLVMRQFGTFGPDDRSERINRVVPTPLTCGELRAQQVYRHSWAKTKDAGSWSVHDHAGAVVGRIDWETTARAREFFTGRLSTWEQGAHVDGPTPLAVLRKIAKGIS